MHHGACRVQVTICVREQPVNQVAVLLRGGWHRQGVQPTGGVDEGNTRSFDEDLFDTGAGQQVGERAELGDGAQHAFGHLAGIVKRSTVPQMRQSLVVIHYLGHEAQGSRSVPPGVDLALFDELCGAPPNLVVGVHLEGHGPTPEVRGAVGEAKSAASRPSALLKRPGATRRPSQEASSTLRSNGANVTLAATKVLAISSMSSPRLKSDRGERFTTK